MNNKEKADEYFSKNKSKIKDSDRPVYHFTPDIGWMNDPNGFSYFNGEYHLFYQYNPYDIKWGPMHWGHAKTRDFVNWDRLPVALAPDDEIKGQCFSGTAIADNDKHILVYTVHSNDKEEQTVEIGDGVNYKAVSDKPVIGIDKLPKGFGGVDFRDPKIWKEDNIYYCIASAKNDRGLGSILLFESKDLLEWNYVGILFENDGKYGKMWECPDFFKLGDKYVLVISVMGMQARKRKYFNGHQVIYFVGTYDKSSHKFIPNGRGKTFDFGFDFYAPQSLYADGRTLSVAWLHDWSNDLTLDDAKWCGQTTFPRELKLEGNDIYQMPAGELESHYKNKYHTSFILNRNKEYIDNDLNSRAARFDFDIENIDADKLILFLAANDEYNSFIKINMKKKTLKFSRRFSGLCKDAIDERKIDIDICDGQLSLSVLVDRFSIEIFVNKGKEVLTSRIYTPLDANEIRFLADGKLKIDVSKNEIE